MRKTTIRLLGIIMFSLLIYGCGSPPPQPVPLQDIIAVGAGFDYSLALKDDGTVWFWGNLVFGTIKEYKTPVQVEGLSGVTAIACGSEHILALKNDGTVWAWGNNSNGQLGNGNNIDSNTPVQVSGISNVIKIACGGGHSLALKSDGMVWAWGFNSEGQLGNESNAASNIPVQVHSLTNVIAIAPGGEGGHCLAMKDDGTVWSWGANSSGQLGNGIFSSNIPVQVNGIMGMAVIACGFLHSLAVNHTGAVWAWGDNRCGQLGFVTSNDGCNIPTQINLSNLSDINEIVGGSAHSLAVKGDGTVWAWGYNGCGQLGNGTWTDSNIPIQVTGISSVVSIAGGCYHNLALKNDGTVWAWGRNTYYQLGDGTWTTRNVPVQVIYYK